MQFLTKKNSENREDGALLLNVLLALAVSSLLLGSAAFQLHFVASRKLHNELEREAIFSREFLTRMLPRLIRESAPPRTLSIDRLDFRIACTFDGVSTVSSEKIFSCAISCTPKLNLDVPLSGCRTAVHLVALPDREGIYGENL